MEKLILIADNAAPVREVLREAIAELRREAVAAGELLVETVASGQALLERCAARPADLIVMDVDMPELDGIETFYRLRERDPQQARRTVFLTGVAGSGEFTERLEQALADGARGVVLKPVSMADLAKLLDRHLPQRP